MFQTVECLHAAGTAGVPEASVAWQSAASSTTWQHDQLRRLQQDLVHREAARRTAVKAAAEAAEAVKVISVCFCAVDGQSGMSVHPCQLSPVRRRVKQQLRTRQGGE
jgi:hypothetical protein